MKAKIFVLKVKIWSSDTSCQRLWYDYLDLLGSSRELQENEEHVKSARPVGPSRFY